MTSSTTHDAVNLLRGKLAAAEAASVSDRDDGGGREWVIGFFRQLQQTGIATVRCGDLAAALANRVRAEWAARHAVPADELAPEGNDELATSVRMVWPDESLEARERWKRLKRLVPGRIADLDRQERVRARLAEVFAALVQAVEEGSHAPPTQAELVEWTGIPRATLSDDFRLLREIKALAEPDIKYHEVSDVPGGKLFLLQDLLLKSLRALSLPHLDRVPERFAFTLRDPLGRRSDGPSMHIVDFECSRRTSTTAFKTFS